MTEPLINHALIRARVAALGLADEFAARTGVHLAELEIVVRPELSSVRLLLRIAAVLDLDPGDLIARPAGLPADNSADEDRADDLDDHVDDKLAEAVLAEHEAFTFDELADILGWTHGRLDAALNALEVRLADTPHRLIRTADIVELTAHTTILPPAAWRRLVAWRRGRALLTPQEASVIVDVIRLGILRPFFAGTTLMKSYFDPASHRDLISRQLLALPPTALPSPGTLYEISCHPDVMFALRLATEPSVDHPVDGRMW
ncbi:hypothetical protein GCM10023194_57160 [Planotetraspora phitsanulokensis]|uniref:Uncharacterized protein n=1 Tax=Planotetraspora phitsanulokensis TaxID=575192 RepID=A0A8J3UD71_9ACTN|nr:hypothetical protein [Planotetraspora phitsanulokensis]GII43073.1 hypothetical protein Pph01_80760 [Planotetraspora phitsanulokensis]